MGNGPSLFMINKVVSSSLRSGCILFCQIKSKPFMLKCLCSRDPLLRLDSEAPLDEVLDKCTILFIKSIPVPLQERNRTMAVGEFADLRGLVRSAELVEQNTERPHVDLRADQFVIVFYFWCHVT